MNLFKKIKIKKLKKNEMESVELRLIYKKLYEIDVGLYSYGCFDEIRFPRGIIFGRYCSIAPEVRFFSRNHGISYISTHPYLYNSNLGVVAEDNIKNKSCVVEDDVWIGFGAVILPSVSNIGRGSIIGAGSIVTKNVPPYAIVAGNPAKIIKYRFNEDIIKWIEKSEWWLLSRSELFFCMRKHNDVMLNPDLNKYKFSDLLNTINYLKSESQ